MAKSKIFVIIIVWLLVCGGLGCFSVYEWQQCHTLKQDYAKLAEAYKDLSNECQVLAKQFQEQQQSLLILNLWYEQDGYDSADQWWVDLQNYRAGYADCDEKVLKGENKDYVTEEQRQQLSNLADQIENSRNPVELQELVNQFNQIVKEIENQKQQISTAEYYNYSWADNSIYNIQTPSNGLTIWSGINYYNDRIETYYSSNVLYHYRTSEWTVDSEGFYRDSDGNYVVAASDMPQGTVFEGSKGACKVYDSGCADGITDYYVNW